MCGACTHAREKDDGEREKKEVERAGQLRARAAGWDVSLHRLARSYVCSIVAVVGGSIGYKTFDHCVYRK